VLVTADDVARGKPAPDAYLMAAEKLGFKPEDCVVFEDAPAGVKAAVSAGMRVFGLFTSQGVDELWEAEMVIEDLSMVKVIEVSDGRLRVVIGEFG
jgi:sugar-phosphatase